MRTFKSPELTDEIVAATEHQLARAVPSGGCLLWRGPSTPNGYPTVRIRKGGVSRLFMATRLVFRIKIGDLPPTEVIRHECDTPLCVQWEGVPHLRPGSSSSNTLDMHTRHRHNRSRKMTVAFVREARQRRAQGEEYKSIAADAGVHPSTIWMACNGRNWKEVR